jgi:hypothetical protein
VKQIKLTLLADGTYAVMATRYGAKDWKLLGWGIRRQDVKETIAGANRELPTEKPVLFGR